MYEIERQQMEIERIEEQIPKCANCKNKADVEDFSDVLVKCKLDGLEKGKHSVCENFKRG